MYLDKLHIIIDKFHHYLFSEQMPTDDKSSTQKQIDDLSSTVEQQGKLIADLNCAVSSLMVTVIGFQTALRALMDAVKADNIRIGVL